MPKPPAKPPPQEIELKFAAPAGRPGDGAAAIEALAGALPRELTSIYFDTAKAEVTGSWCDLEAPAGLCWQVGSLVGFGTWFLTAAFIHHA